MNEQNCILRFSFLLIESFEVVSFYCHLFSELPCMEQSVGIITFLRDTNLY